MQKSVGQWFGAAALSMGMASTSYAYMLPDATVVLDKAANNRTLTVRYSGAAVALVELRINGKSIATRTTDEGTNAGETNFRLDPAQLEDGDNTIEIRLFDKEGTVVGTQTTSIRMERQATGPVFLKNPTSGTQLKGTVEIQVGFKSPLSNVYVSFFVDGEFMSLRNTAPYRWLWDTTRVTNGWHEVQAWVIDETNNTFKTERVRVLVNNPGGRTDRVDAGDPVTSANGTVPVTGPDGTTSNPRVVVTGDRPNQVPTSLPATAPTTSSAAGTRTPASGPGTAHGPRSLTPTGQRPLTGDVKPVTVAPAGAPVRPEGNGPGVVEVTPAEGNNNGLMATIPPVDLTAAVGSIPLTFGTRVPNIGEYTISMGGKAVNFDVQPRVEEGIALTPFRHLFESAGGYVQWDNATKTVTATNKDQKVWFAIGNMMANVNDVSIPLERAAFIDHGRSIVPLSFFSNALGVSIEFDARTKHALISTNTARR
ncbi:MAG TPA: stalk domain-containing protein [Fimbriimonadaceae bacterium]|nr:stalk domain-containing protein [Fimbriimonadaceae bacterium]